MAEEIITETNRETATDHAYGGAQIQVLEGLEAVRKRPGMYIGSTGPSGLHHLVYEIVDNAIDEALAGYCTHIEVAIKPGNIIEVSDNGRGIPVDIQPKLGIPAVTVVYTVLHAGGKFGGEDSGYKVAGGLHGVGASVVNALSEWLNVVVRKDGVAYKQSFKRGVADADLQNLGPTDEPDGTTVTFKPDPEMFEVLDYDYDTLNTRLREEAFLNAGVRITLTDERAGQEKQESMCYEGGIRSFVDHIHQKRQLEVLHKARCLHVVTVAKHKFLVLGRAFHRLVVIAGLQGPVYQSHAQGLALVFAKAQAVAPCETGLHAVASVKFVDGFAFREGQTAHYHGKAQFLRYKPYFYRTHA